MSKHDDDQTTDPTEATDDATDQAGATEAADEPDNDAADDQPGNDAAAAEPDDGADTFDRPYVEKLRAEAASYRTRVKDLEAKLHRMMVDSTGALADPADLEFNAEHLDDPEALNAAIDELLAARPHLKARRFEPGAAAQGARSTSSASVDLAGLMRQSVI